MNLASWDVYAVQQRTIIKEHALTGFRQADKIIAPMDSIFPLVDFVVSLFSKDGSQEAPTFNARGAISTASVGEGVVHITETAHEDSR